MVVMESKVLAQKVELSLLGQSQALWLAPHISHRCRKLQEDRWQIHCGRWWLGCAMVGLLSLGCPRWDTLPDMGGGYCPAVDVEVGNGCGPLPGSCIDWA